LLLHPQLSFLVQLLSVHPLLRFGLLPVVLLHEQLLVLLHERHLLLLRVRHLLLQLELLPLLRPE
jgi:hypothetical protein